MWKRIFIRVLVLLIILALSMIITRCYYYGVMNSDLPDWIKWLLLRGGGN